MAYNKFLEDKWRKAFRFFDIDKDGYVTERDWEILAAYISKKTGATEEAKAKTRYEYVKWFEYFRSNPSVKEVSEEMMVRGNAELYKDIDKMKLLNAAFYSDLFNNFDINKDGRISHEELKIHYEGHGIKDERYIRRVFDQIDADKDGYIDRDELVEAGIQYWTSSDENDKSALMYDVPWKD